MEFKEVKEVKTDELKANEYITVVVTLNYCNKNGYSSFFTQCDINAEMSDDLSTRDMLTKYANKYLIFEALNNCDEEGVPTGYANMAYCKDLKNKFLLTDTEATFIKNNAFIIDTKYNNYLIHKFGLRQRWKKRADEAIKLLEELTGKTFKRHGSKFKPITVEEIKDVEEKLAAGFYNVEAVIARKAKAKAEQKRSKKAKVLADFKKRHKDFIAVEKVSLKLALCCIELDFDRTPIYYHNTKTIVFNWLTTNTFTEDQYKKFVSTYGYKFKDITLKLGE